MDKKKALEHIKELLKAARDNPQAIEELEKKLNLKDYGKKAALIVAGYGAGVGDTKLMPKYKEAAHSAKEGVKSAVHAGASKVAEATKPEVKKEELEANESCSYKKMSKEEICEELKKPYEPRFKKSGDMAEAKMKKEEMEKGSAAPAPAPMPPKPQAKMPAKPSLGAKKAPAPQKQPVQLFAASEDKKIEKSEGDSKKAKVVVSNTSNTATQNLEEVSKAQPVKGQAKRMATMKEFQNRRGNTDLGTSEGISNFAAGLKDYKNMNKPDPLAQKDGGRGVSYSQGFDPKGHPNTPIATISLDGKVPRKSMGLVGGAVHDQDYDKAKNIIANRLGDKGQSYFRKKLKR
jgi:hypothetical protein